MPADEVVFSIKVWCLLLGRTCLELAWQHRSSSFSKDFREMPAGEVVFSIKVWCLLLGRTCLELAWQHRSSSFSKDFRKGNASW